MYDTNYKRIWVCDITCLNIGRLPSQTQRKKKQQMKHIVVLH